MILLRARGLRQVCTQGRGKTVRALRECPHLRIEIWGPILLLSLDVSNSPYCWTESDQAPLASELSDDRLLRRFEEDDVMAQADAQTSERSTRLMGTRGSQSAYAIRDFLQRSDVPFEWIELTSDEEAREKAGVSGLRDGRLPVCVLPDGTRLECPTIREIIEKLGWFHDPSRKEYDLAILGGGPAG